MKKAINCEIFLDVVRYWCLSIILSVFGKLYEFIFLNYKEGNKLWDIFRYQILSFLFFVFGKLYVYIYMNLFS